eukprot:4093547-Amphidinium_carterae.1
MECTCFCIEAFNSMRAFIYRTARLALEVCVNRIMDANFAVEHNQVRPNSRPTRNTIQTNYSQPQPKVLNGQAASLALGAAEHRCVCVCAATWEGCSGRHNTRKKHRYNSNNPGGVIYNPLQKLTELNWASLGPLRVDIPSMQVF